MSEVPSTFEKTPSREKVRVSVSNLVHRVRVRETGETHQIAMRNEKVWQEKEEKKYQALGGAAKMTPKGKQMLINEYGAQFGLPGRPIEEANDSRFILSVKNQEEAILPKVLDSFSVQDTKLFESDVLREVHEDLVGAGVLSEEEFQTISATYEGAVSPIRWKETTSERETGTPSERIFHLFEIEVPQVVYEKMQQADALHFLSAADVVSIHKATQEGKPAAKLSDGSTIVENIFPEL